MQCIASDQPGAVTFYGIPHTGLSTADLVVAQQRKDLGMTVHSFTVEARTLTSLCEQHAADRLIHFLRSTSKATKKSSCAAWTSTASAPGSS